MNQLIMILLISLLILVHEAGHFFAARMCGIRVTRFGIGMPFGPSWKLFRWKQTDFYIHAFLFGGYVSFPEDESQFEDKDEKKEDKEPKEEIPPEELYDNKTIGQKLFVVSAGVIMNVVCAFVLVLSCAVCYHKLPTSSQNLFVEGYSKNITSNAEQKGITKGDKILKVNSIDIESLYQLTFFAKNSKLFDDYAQVDLIEKNLAELKKLNPSLEDDVIALGQEIKLPKEMTENPLAPSRDMLKGLEKYKKDGVHLTPAQIDLRDKIYSQKTLKIDGNYTLDDIAIALSDTYKPIAITVLRGDKEVTFSDIKVQKEGLLGVMLKIEEIFVETKTPKDMIVKSFDYLYTTPAMMLKGLAQLVTGKVSMSDMHGVIAVVKVGGDIIASKGLVNGILLTAMISINLAIMNFLPIPALDGGHVMFLIVEKLTGRKPTKEMAENINNFFFILLILLMVAICYNDIFALVTKKF